MVCRGRYAQVPEQHLTTGERRDLIEGPDKDRNELWELNTLELMAMNHTGINTVMKQ